MRRIRIAAARPNRRALDMRKAAADHLAATWGSELPSPRFLAVDPGEMDTAMHAAAVPEADRSTLLGPVQAAAQLLGLILGPVQGRVVA